MRYKVRTAGGIIVLVSLIGATAVSAAMNPDVYEQALSATGWLINPREKNTAMGTCWLADRDNKLVVTSAHLVGESKEVLVYFPLHVDGKLVVEAGHYLKNVATINGTVIAADSQRDLAIVQLESLPDGVTQLALAKESARPGSDVHSIGNSGLIKNAGGMLWRYTRGNVRQIYSRKITTTHGQEQVQLVETQSPVNLGDSGGPLLNEHGDVVGVIAAYDPDERLVSQNIDVSEVRKFLQSSLADLRKAKKNAKPAAMNRNSPIGEWTMFAKLDDGSRVSGKAHFRRDGTYQLIDSEDAEDGSQRGRFLYANGILLLIADDGQATFKLAWKNTNDFNASHEGVKLFFRR